MSDLEGIHKQVIRAAMSAPYLQREEEHELALRSVLNVVDEALGRAPPSGAR